MSRPSKITRPAVARHSPMIVRSVVVLPAPFRPRRSVSSPRGHRSSPREGCDKGPIRVSTPSSLRIGSAIDRGVQPEIGFPNDCRIHDRFGLAVGNESAVVKDDDPSASARTTSSLCSTSRMARSPSVLRSLMSSRIGGYLVDTHSGRWLVEHEDLGLQRDHQGDLELALIAMRKCGREHRRLVRQPDPFQNGFAVFDKVAPAGPAVEDVESRIGACLDGQAYVFADAQAGERGW